MPAEQQHLARYAANDRLSQELARQQQFEWSATLLFYAAVHLVDACLARSNEHPKSHGRRQALIGRHTVLSVVQREYDELESRSRDARYECIPFTAVEVQNLRSQFFVPLEQQLRGWLGI